MIAESLHFRTCCHLVYPLQCWVVTVSEKAGSLYIAKVGGWHCTDGLLSVCLSVCLGKVVGGGVYVTLVGGKGGEEVEWEEGAKEKTWVEEGEGGELLVKLAELLFLQLLP